MVEHASESLKHEDEDEGGKGVSLSDAPRGVEGFGHESI